MATKSQKIPFGLKGELMVSVAEVQSGLACGCHCPACGEPLIARKGLKNVHHFAHHSESACASAFETSVHLMAKQIIAEEKSFKIPRLELRRSKTHPNGFSVSEKLLVTEAKRQRFSSVWLECSLGQIKPDVIGEFRGRKLLMEIYVTHKVDESKRDLLRKENLSVIEIDLSGVDYAVTKQELRELVIESPDNKTWISFANYKNRMDELEKKLIAKYYAKLKRHWAAWARLYEELSENEAHSEPVVARQTYFNKKQATDTIWPEKNDVLNLRSKFPNFYPRQ